MLQYLYALLFFAFYQYFEFLVYLFELFANIFLKFLLQINFDDFVVFWKI